MDRGITERQFWCALVLIILMAHVFITETGMSDEGRVEAVSETVEVAPDVVHVEGEGLVVPAPVETPVVETDSAKIEPLFAAADEFDIPHEVAWALVQAESGGNPEARSPVGALGLTQIMPETGQEIAVEIGLVENPLDFDVERLIREPELNVRFGMYYLRQQLDQFGGNVDLALAAYNAGAGSVQAYGGIPPFPETHQYVYRNNLFREQFLAARRDNG